MNRNKSAKSKQIKSLEDQTLPREPKGRPKYRMVLTCLAVLGLIGGLVWMGQHKNSPSKVSRPTGPRLQADPRESGLESQEPSFQLPANPESIEMTKLQDEMIAQARHLETFYPQTPAALDLAASVYYDLNRLDEADRLWKACLALSPGEAEYYVNYSQFLNNLERADEAISILNSAHAKSIETAGTYHLLAMAYDRSGQTEKAGEVSQEVTRRFPDFGDSWLLTGKIQNQLGRFSDAENSLQKALELGQADSDVWPVLIPVLARLGNRQQATELRAKMKSLLDAAKVTDSDGELQPFQAKFEASLRTRAVQLFQRAATIEKRAWNTNQALRLVTRSIQLEPNSPLSLVYLAELLIEANRINDAIYVYQRLIDIQPENVINFSNLAGLAFRENKQQLAARTLEAGIQVHPDVVALQIPLAKVYMGLGRPLEAREIANKILTKQSNPEAMMILGASYQLTGDKDEAAKAFERARSMTVDPIKK